MSILPDRPRSVLFVVKVWTGRMASITGEPDLIACLNGLPRQNRYRRQMTFVDISC
jgi:hypothetical protein